jgi:hypothetical protein
LDVLVRQATFGSTTNICQRATIDLNARAMLSGSWCGLLSDRKARATIKNNINVSLSCLLSGRKGMFDSLSCLLLCPYGHHPPRPKGMNQDDDDDLDEVSCCGIMVVNHGSHHDASKAERETSRWNMALWWESTIGATEGRVVGMLVVVVATGGGYRRRLPEEAMTTARERDNKDVEVYRYQLDQVKDREGSGRQLPCDDIR